MVTCKGLSPSGNTKKKIYKKSLTKRKNYGIMNMKGRKEEIK